MHLQPPREVTSQNQGCAFMLFLLLLLLIRLLLLWLYLNPSDSKPELIGVHVHLLRRYGQDRGQDQRLNVFRQ
ncbi:hypothetical protein T484DRAFT_1948318 [Baffinella frigidus]|nr:hypothetical protein T484DRAFT_1948318 [Cryptophyta sp. CCMP2293]